MADPSFYNRSRQPRKSWFPTWAYYVSALLLFLPTIPMYRYLLHRAGYGDLSSSASVGSASPAPPRIDAAELQAAMPQSPRLTYELQAAAHHLSPAPSWRRLAPDEHCTGGTIVRVDVVEGVTMYTQETSHGLPLACPQGVYY